VTTLSRVVAYGLAVALAGGLVVLAVAGVPAATAVLVTGAAVFVMIVLGGAVGGRSGTRRPPVPRPESPGGSGRAGSPGGPASPAEGGGGGTIGE